MYFLKTGHALKFSESKVFTTIPCIIFTNSTAIELSTVIFVRRLGVCEMMQCKQDMQCVFVCV